MAAAAIVAVTFGFNNSCLAGKKEAGQVFLAEDYFDLVPIAQPEGSFAVLGYAQGVSREGKVAGICWDTSFERKLFLTDEFSGETVSFPPEVNPQSNAVFLTASGFIVGQSDYRDQSWVFYPSLGKAVVVPKLDGISASLHQALDDGERVFILAFFDQEMAIFSVSPNGEVKEFPLSPNNGNYYAYGGMAWDSSEKKIWFYNQIGTVSGETKVRFGKLSLKKGEVKDVAYVLSGEHWIDDISSKGELTGKKYSWDTAGKGLFFWKFGKKIEYVSSLEDDGFLVSNTQKFFSKKEIFGLAFNFTNYSGKADLFFLNSKGEYDIFLFDVFPKSLGAVQEDGEKIFLYVRETANGTPMPRFLKPKN